MNDINEIMFGQFFSLFLIILNDKQSNICFFLTANPISDNDEAI